MQVYADPITVNCRKVLAGLDFLNAPFERLHVDYFKGEQKEPAYVAINPNASVPALRDGDFVLWESNAILQRRADINRWLLWESSSWFPSAYVFLVENCVKPLLGAEPDPAVLDAQATQFHKLAGILDARLAQSAWVCGDVPTIADIALASPIHLHAWQKLPLADHPHLKRWMTEQVEPLPCWKKTFVGPGFTLTPPAN